MAAMAACLLKIPVIKRSVSASPILVWCLLTPSPASHSLAKLKRLENHTNMLSLPIVEDGFGTARPVVPLSRSRCPVVPLAVAVGSQRAAAWRTFAFRRHFGKNEVR